MTTPDSYFWRQKNDDYIYVHKQNNETFYYLLSNGSENSKTKGGNVSTLVISQLVFRINEMFQYVTVSRKNNGRHLSAARLPHGRDSSAADPLLALGRRSCCRSHGHTRAGRCCQATHGGRAGSGLRATAARTSNGSRFQAGDLAQIAEISSELNPGNEKSFLLLLRGWVGTGKRRRQKTGTGRRQTAKRWLPTALHGNAKADGQPGPQHTGSEGAGMCSGVSEASHRNSLASGRLVPRMQNASQGEEAQRQEVPCQCLSPRLRTSKQESTVTSPVPSSDLEGIKGE